MYGIWFAAMVAVLMAAGVAAQLGWEPPAMTWISRLLRLPGRRSDGDAAVAERR